jgi:iron complex outermembrane recepter protein
MTSRCGSTFSARSTRRGAAAAGAVAAALFATGIAGAQSAAPAGDGALEEIVITAEKREATLQDTPISIAAFSGDDLAAAGVVSTEALSGLAPGLNVQREVIGKVVIRGVGTEKFSVGSDPGVAIHQDGVYMARSSVSVFEFFDTQRIEVLRGPQGTLYGRNATGGVINIISNKPEAEFGGYARVDLGNYSKKRIEAALNAPFGESAAGRLSVMWADRDGYTENLNAGARARGLAELDNQELWGVRGQLKFGSSDAFEGLIQLDVLNDDSNPPAFKYFTHASGGVPWSPVTAGMAAVPGDAVLTDLRQVSQGFEATIPGSPRTVPAFGGNELQAANVRLTWDLGTVSLMSQTAYRKTDFSWLNDGDGVDAFFVTYFQDDDSKQLTQELQLSSNTEGRLQWILGAFYLKEESDTFSGLAFNIGIPAPGINGILIDGESNTESYSIFGQATFDFTDRLRGTLGVRYTQDDKDGDLVYNLFGGVLPPPGPMGTTWPQVLNDSWSATTPKVGLDFDFTDDVMGYFSATRGFKSGGFNLIAVQTPYDPEYLWSYELGLKTRLADGRVIANFGAFYYDYEDMQVGKIVNLSDVLTNAAGSTVKGLEAEVRASLGNGFELNLGAAFLDAKFDEFLTEDPAVNAAPAALGPNAGACERRDATATSTRGVSLAGCDLRRAPEFSGNLGLAWEGSVASGGAVTVRADYAYKGKQYFTQFNREQVSQDSYGLVNLRVGYRSPDDVWGVTLWGDNLADEDYFSTVLESGVPPPGGLVPQAVMGAPRTYGVTFNYNF